MEVLDEINSDCLLILNSNLPSYASWEKNHLKIAHIRLLPMAGIEPGPPAQQAFVLSIALLHCLFAKLVD